MVDKEQDPVLWMRSKVEALKVLLENPDIQSEQWTTQYLRAAEDLRDFWNSQYELVREFTEDDWHGLSGSQEFYGQKPPLIGTEGLDMGEEGEVRPALLIGDHEGIHILVSDADYKDEEAWTWDWRGYEHNPFVISAVMEKILREKMTREQILGIGPTGFKQ